MLFSGSFFIVTQATPVVLLCFVYVLLFVLLSEAGLLVFNLCYGKKQRIEQSNEVAGLMFGAISLIYSLILAFVIVAVWTNYDDLNRTVEHETDKLNSILAHSMALPDSLKRPLAGALYNYCNQVINTEWKMHDLELPHSPSAIPALRERLHRFEPQTKAEENICAVLDENLSCISDLRRARLDHTRSLVPELVWLILNTGSVILIIFSYFLNTHSEKLKRIYLFFLSSIIGMSLFLVYTLDHPFNGSVQVSKKLYEDLLLEINQNWNPSSN